MEIKYFHTLKIGDSFVVDGEKYIKHSELVFRDAYGFEHYIDPLFDVKLGKALADQQESTPEVDTSAKIVKEPTE